MQVILDIALIIAAGLASAGWFTSTTSVASDVADPVVLAVASVAVAAAGIALGGLPTRKRLQRLGTRDALAAAAAGAVAFALVPMAVLALRKTDAPSGSETLFFTTAAWAVLVVACALVARRTATFTQLAGALLALLGAAAVVANWERPSSFSPLVKFPQLEAGMLLAGLAFAVCTVVLSRLMRRYGVRIVVSFAAVAAGVVGATVGAIGAGPAMFAIPSYALVRLGIAAVSLAAFSCAWMFALSSLGAARTAPALFIPPVALTAIGAAESLGRAYGVNPIQWSGAGGGLVLIACGSVVVYMLGRRLDATKSRPDLVACALASVAVLAGAVSLVLPAFAASISGTVAGKDFEAHWVMRGFESASGWLPLALGLLALAASLDVEWRGWGRRERVVAAVAVALSAVTWPLLFDSPLRTWALWIPAEVLQDLGTEYASVTMNPVSQPAGLVGVVFAVISAIALVVGARFWRAETGRRVEGQA